VWGSPMSLQTAVFAPNTLTALLFAVRVRLGTLARKVARTTVISKLRLLDGHLSKANRATGATDYP
jgi:hypothetical protein